MHLQDFDLETQQLVQAIREKVAQLHAELPRWGLVVWTAGNVSEKVPGTNLFVIKPSGVNYDELKAETMVVCTLDGQQVLDGKADHLHPSSDTAAHAYVYRHMPEVGGVVHTHSTYATAFAIQNAPIPCLCTMQGDEFGGQIPVGPFAIIGDDSIGRGIVQTLRESRSRAVLMAGHGPFTIGKNGTDAVKAAVMVEEVAKTTYTALTLGAATGTQVPQLPAETVTKLWERYQNVYGQKQ